jgi:hypothetical protein
MHLTTVFLKQRRFLEFTLSKRHANSCFELLSSFNYLIMREFFDFSEGLGLRHAPTLSGAKLSKDLTMLGRAAVNQEQIAKTL